MKKNLLAAIVIFLFTFIVMLVMSDIHNTNDPAELQTNYYAIED
jgi:hypothetical protein